MRFIPFVFDMPTAGGVNSGRANQALPSTWHDVVAESRGCKLERPVEDQLFLGKPWGWASRASVRCHSIAMNIPTNSCMHVPGFGLQFQPISGHGVHLVLSSRERFSIRGTEIIVAGCPFLRAAGCGSALFHKF